MKKLVLAAIMISSMSVGQALPIGNPYEASFLTTGMIWRGIHSPNADTPVFSWHDILNFRAGFYGDYVFNRHMAYRRDDGHNRRIEHTQIFTNAAYFVVNFLNRFDFFSTLGATSLGMATNVNIFAPPSPITSRLVVESETEFSWSVGGRTTLWECGCSSFGIEAQYFQTNPKIKRITIGESTSFYPEDKAGYYEWQVGLGYFRRIYMFVPYVAVKWARCNWRFKDLVVEDNIIPNITSARDWGYAIGTSLIACESVAFTIEGRFGDEKALYINGQMRF